MSSALFQPLQVGAIRLKHRIVMAPLTRMRAVPPGNLPGPLAPLYYAQRASDGGLLIAEASPVCLEAHGHPDVPGIYSDAQAAAWRRVTQAVHERGGAIFLQLWHTGRVSHSRYQPDGRPPPAPSAVPAEGELLLPNAERVPYEVPREMTLAEIREIIDVFHRAARRAIEAGFDGVELHAANGYLIEQFLQSRSNLRSDAYGGSIAHRVRFLIEVTEALAAACSADRVGVRLSPFGIANGSGEDDPFPLYRQAIEALAPLRLAYLHLIEPRTSGTGKTDAIRADQPSAAGLYRRHWPGALIAAGGFDPAGAERIVGEGFADAVAFGRHFIANPDLPARIRLGAPLNPYHRPTFYGGGAVGYVDYPMLQQHGPDDLSGLARRTS
ncbi:MAG: alkene reductase [Burkholderiaceae bacterium]